MDTPPTSSIDCFELFGADAAKVTVTARAIVERINVVADFLSCLISVFVNALLDSLFLETAEERLRHRVIPAVAPAAHAGLQVIGFAEAPPSIAAILRTLIRVNQRMAWAPSTHGHQNCIEHELTMNRWARRPTHDRPRVEIHDNGQVQPALPCANVGYICDPGAIRPSYRELALQHIRNQYGRLAKQIPGAFDSHAAHAARSAALAARLDACCKSRQPRADPETPAARRDMKYMQRDGREQRVALSRRDFIQLAAAMGASLAWGGAVRASQTKWQE